MISIDEAKKLIKENCVPLPLEKRLISKARGYYLAADVHSPVDLPAFRQSAMDGYAFRREDLDKGKRTFEVPFEVQAGATAGNLLTPGSAARIFTGAVVPEGADLVVMQEHTSRHEQTLKVEQYQSNQKTNIRAVGEQIKRGSCAMTMHDEITPAAIGFLAGMGIQEVEVYRKPKIGILATGNELKQAGEPLAAGEIYESNVVTLEAALLNAGFENVLAERVEDDYQATEDAISALIKENDVLIISGGISVGDYDFVKRATEALGITEIFYKIRQKPGKPMFYGRLKDKHIFALPGNPASLLVCFYEYVSPALKKLCGGNGDITAIQAKLSADFHFKGDRPVFLRGRWQDDEVHILDGQSSFVMKSFAIANCLVYIDGSNRTIKKSEIVEIHLI